MPSADDVAVPGVQAGIAGRNVAAEKNRPTPGGGFLFLPDEPDINGETTISNVHVLDRASDAVQGDVNCVMHIAVPSANNAVGVNWRTALINSGIGGKTILPDGDGTAGTISAAEKANIANGSLYEYKTTLRPGTAGNLTNVNAFLDSEFTKATTAVQADLQARLQFYGGVR